MNNRQQQHGLYSPIEPSDLSIPGFSEFDGSIQSPAIVPQKKKHLENTFYQQFHNGRNEQQMHKSDLQKLNKMNKRFNVKNSIKHSPIKLFPT